MRECVLAFLRRVLAPARGAAFPARVGRRVGAHRDLVRSRARAAELGDAGVDAADEPGALRQHGCSYSSWQTYEAQAAAAGWPQRAARMFARVASLARRCLGRGNMRPNQCEIAACSNSMACSWAIDLHRRRQLKLKQLGDFEISTVARQEPSGVSEPRPPDVLAPARSRRAELQGVIRRCDSTRRTIVGARTAVGYIVRG